VLVMGVLSVLGVLVAGCRERLRVGCVECIEGVVR